jgi:tetratricopeptide (TPR) repeat protein
VHGRVRTRPYPGAAKVLEVMFPPWSVTELLAQPSQQKKPVADDSMLSYSASVLDSLDAVGNILDADIYRRDIAKIFSFVLPALYEPARNWLLAALDQTDPTRVGGRTVSRTSLEQIRAVLNVFAQADAQLGGGHGRQALAQYLKQAVLPLLHAEKNEQIRQELFDLAGEQAQLLGWMSYDVGAHGLAQRYLVQALRFSEEAQNPALGAHTLATLSHLATTLGHAGEGVQLARTGQAALRGASNAMLADLAVLEGRSLALAGDKRSAASAVHRAEKALADVVTENEPPEMRFIDQAYISGEIANTLALIGDPARAVDFAQQSIDSSLRQGRSRRGALSSVVLAEALMSRGDLDGACEAGGTQALDGLLVKLRPYGTAQPVLALVEEMEASGTGRRGQAAG